MLLLAAIHLYDLHDFRMAPEVIACDENPDATYDNRVSCSTALSLNVLYRGIL